MLKLGSLAAATFGALAGAVSNPGWGYVPRGTVVPRKHKKWARKMRRLAAAPKPPAGSKLLKAFRRSGNRASHATKPQYSCYGHRSMRAS